MARRVTVTWYGDEGDRIRFEKDMEDDELVDFMRYIENERDFVAEDD